MATKTLQERITKDIYKFDDYREFLASFLKNMKIRTPSYTIQYFSDQCGFKTHSYVILVMQGKRNLTPDGFMRMNKELKLEGKYKKYFRLLMKLNHSKDSQEQTELYNELQKMKKNTAFYDPKEKQYKYFEKWYYPVLRSLVAHSDWGGDYKKLASMCFPKISKRDAEKAVGDLLSSGLIKKINAGKYIILENNVKDESVPIFIKKKARLDIIENNKIALDQLSPEERFSVYCTWATSEKSFNEILKKFEEFKEQAYAIVDNDNEVDKVYNMLFQLFPNSKNLKEPA